MSDRPPFDERSVSQVASTRRNPWLSRRRLLMVGVPVALLVGVLVLWHQPPTKSKDDDTSQLTHLTQLERYIPPKPEPVVAKIPAPPQLPPSLIQQVPSIKEIAKEETHTVSRPAMMSFNVVAIPDAMKPQAVATAKPDTTAVSYKNTPIVGNEARPMGDSSLVLKPGLLRCTLVTAVNSDLAGPFMCTLPDNVMSDQNVVLMDKGTSIIGSYDSKVSQGQKRLMSLTVAAYTPNNCVVPLGGPMADALGRTGLEGSVDNHLWERFGGAVMLMLVDNLFSLAQSEVSKGGNTYVQLQSGDVSNLASEVLRNTINIPPSIEINQGSDVAMWVPTPISFRKCYTLEPRN